MRLIIKEFLTHLKEKDELDLLLHELLVQMGYTIDSYPQTGNRQYGVDIHASKRKNLSLFVIKQNNITRDTWDVNKNSVRQSINEILDFYLSLVIRNKSYEKINIIVATNGYLSEAVATSWHGYIKKNKSWESYEIHYEFWSIDTISQKIEQYMLNERVFDKSMQSSMRKALYFIEENDYKNTFFESIVDQHISKLRVDKKSKLTSESKKILSSLLLSTQMIAYYAASYKKYKISIMVNEYTLIRYWKFLLENQLLGYAKWSGLVSKFCPYYEKWNLMYYEKIKYFCNTKDAFPEFETIVEQKIVLYETLGFLSTFAFYEYFNSGKREAIQKADEILVSIIKLICNNPQIYYPPYDNHIGIIVMIYRLFEAMGKKDSAKNLLLNLSIKMMNYYQLCQKYPAPSDSFKEALNIEYNENDIGDYETSGFWGYILLWIARLSYCELYTKLCSFLNDEIGNVTKCIWIQNHEEEVLFFDKYAMNKSGTGKCFKTPDNYKEFYEMNNFDDLLKKINTIKFSYEEYSFPSLEMIVCRYYGYIPRII